MMRPLAVLALLLALTLALTACGGDGENADNATPTASATASPSPTAPATPSDSPTSSPQPTRPAVPLSPDLAGYRVIFVRGAVPGSYEGLGEIWMSRMDGSDARRITNEGESANLAGIAPHPSTREEGIYFVALDGATARTLWAVDLATSERLKLFSFESRGERVADAAISPDGRYVAYAHFEGIDLVDLYTGARRHLLDNGPYECDAGNCLVHSLPQWSPGSGLLSVRRTFWEGGMNIIFDPFLEPPQLAYEPKPEPFTARWAPASDKACGYGRYADDSGLYLAASPDWSFVNVIPEYEMYPPDLPLVYHNVSGCTFLGGEQVAFTVDVSRYDSDPDPGPPPERSVELRVFELVGGTSSLVAEYKRGVQFASGALLGLPRTDTVLVQLFVDEGVGTVDWQYTQPTLIDVVSRQETPVLEHGDQVVAVLAP